MIRRLLAWARCELRALHDLETVDGVTTCRRPGCRFRFERPPEVESVFVNRESVPPGMDIGSETAWIRAIACSQAQVLGIAFDSDSVVIRSVPAGWRVSWLRRDAA